MKDVMLTPALQEAIEQRDVATLQTFCRLSHPAHIAEVLSALPPQQIWEIFQYLSVELQAEIFSHLDPELQSEMTDMLDRTSLARIISAMPPDDRVDVFKKLPEAKQALILPALAHAEREDIRKLASYTEGTAGAVMTSDYATVFAHQTAAQAIEKLRLEAPNKETIYYAYIVDEQRRLLGFVSLKDLILAKSDVRLHEIMHEDVVAVHVEDDQEEAARQIQKYDLIAIPVVNGSQAVVGIITHDDALDIITQEQTEDMEKFMAITGPHEIGVYLRTPTWMHFKNRVVWLIGLAVVGLISGTIIHRFEATLMHLIILALYMPMLADTGGNTGSQAATVVVRALALQEISAKDSLRVLWKELRISLMLAVVLGGLAWGKVMFLSRGVAVDGEYSLGLIGAAIAIALGLQVITSTVVGAMLPLIASKFKVDPALTASPALTTIVDITGLLLYFTTVKLVLQI